MPELPEVEIIKRNLTENLLNKTFLSVEVYCDKLRYKIPQNFIETIKNKKVINIERIAKYICITLDNDNILVIHLGMTGNFLVNHMGDKIIAVKHTHIKFFMSNFKVIRYIDIRRFGFIIIFKSNEAVASFFKKKLGVDAISGKFNSGYLINKLKNKKIDIKNALLDQKIVGGVGNIYASEALYRAGVSPFEKSEDIAKNNEKVANLIDSIKFILKDAIKLGGSTISDYKNMEGKTGYFQYKFNVYNRENLECNNRNCQSLIKKIKQSGRSTFYCNSCQKG
jgi:formamidopyrimidine-DNA glycosylase